MEALEELCQIIERAFNWSDDHAEESQRSKLEEELKRVRRSLGRVKRGLNHRSATAIFGQSQVGKSYLVKNLLKTSDSPVLMINAGEELFDFIEDINPPGDGRESTGLVTRFTTKENANDEGYPIQLQILGHLELATIVTNGYCLNLKNFPKQPEANLQGLTEQIDNLRSSVPTELNEDEVYEFANYLENRFGDMANIRLLSNAGYFNFIRKELHRISAEARIDILSLLWDKNPHFTELFEKLTSTLSDLSFSKKVQVEVSAVSPREKTLIDVERIRELNSNGDRTDMVKAKDERNQLKEIPRAQLAAVTKEVELLVNTNLSNDGDRNFLTETDLLDFPGSKSFQSIDCDLFNRRGQKFQSEGDELELFIRGKVSYLFDNYTYNFGVSSLLYCMSDDAPEDTLGPERLERWVNTYVGTGPEERVKSLNRLKQELELPDTIQSGSISPLFLVMTKFNREMTKFTNQRAANDNKWYTRINVNFKAFMERPANDRWVSNWIGEDKGFPFACPIRDPKFSGALFSGNAEFIESEVQEQHRPFLENLGESFLNHPDVKKHILEPNELWHEISSPNGTGVKYLCKHLGRVAKAKNLETAIKNKLDDSRDDMISILSPYVFSGDEQKDLKEAQARASINAMNLAGMRTKKNGVLPLILNELKLQPHEVWNLLYDYRHELRTREAAYAGNRTVIDFFKSLNIPSTAFQDAHSLKQALMSRLNLSLAQIEEDIQQRFEVSIEKIPDIVRQANAGEEDSFSLRVISLWNIKITEFFESNKLVDDLLDKDREALIVSVNEIIKAQETFNLKDELERVDDDLYTGVLDLSDYNLVASGYCDVINAFFFSAGWRFQSEENKPRRMGAVKDDLPIFSSKAERRDMAPDYFDKERHASFLEDWSIGVENLFQENVKYQYGVSQTLDFNSNEELAEIIGELESVII